MTILIICVNALKNKHAKLYISSTFQTSNIELLSSKLRLNIHLTKSLKCDNIYKLCSYMLEEHNFLILTSQQVPVQKYTTHARKL